MEKVQALADFLDVNVEDIEVEEHGTFSIGQHEEFLVMTDEEADEYTAERIKETLWAFNVDFILSHVEILPHDRVSEEIIETISEKCEDGNAALERLIDDMDEFIKDAIDSDGRGAFISGYDGAEVLHEGYYIYRIN